MIYQNFSAAKIIKTAQKRGVRFYFLIHDLELLRYAQTDKVPLKHKVRIYFQENVVLKLADGIIVHNDTMKDILVNKGGIAKKIVSLETFDYLISESKERQNLEKNSPVI